VGASRHNLGRRLNPYFYVRFATTIPEISDCDARIDDERHGHGDLQHFSEHPFASLRETSDFPFLVAHDAIGNRGEVLYTKHIRSSMNS
jgi:hypothetical protein